jgi:hypothetical protein
MALAAALLILFWPTPDEQLADYALRDLPEKREIVPAAHRQLGRIWVEHFPELAQSGPYSHAQVRAVSF